MNDFFRRIREQQELIRRITEGPAKYVRENQAAITRMHELVRTAESASASLTKLRTPEFLTAMDHYLRQQREMHKTVEHLGLSHKAWTDNVAAMSSLIEATRFTIPTIDFEQIGSLIAAADRQRDTVARRTRTLLFRHADLIESISRLNNVPASVPLAVSDLPTLDVFVHTSAVRSITPHEPLADEGEEIAVPLRRGIIAETGVFLEQTLPDLKPAFLEQYRGVKARANDRGPDGWTQGSASMRKLVKGVLHSVAPNEIVLPWAIKNNKALDQHRRPTRATKVDWLCHCVPNHAYRAFVHAELRSALAIIELLDTAQHVDEFPQFTDQYDWIMLRAEVCIRHMIALWKLHHTDRSVE